MSYALRNPIGVDGNGVTTYSELHLPSDEQLRDELERIVDSWTTPEQRLQNAWRRAHQKVCRKCRGRGYQRSTPQIRCAPCAGTGWVNREA